MEHSYRLKIYMIFEDVLGNMIWFAVYQENAVIDNLW